MPTLPSWMQYFYVILCQPSHPANIGAVARAMKTMGIHQLRVVRPNLIATLATPNPPHFDCAHPHNFSVPEESFTLASAAKDILEKTRFFASLSEAIAPMHLSYALTSRKRGIAPSLQTPAQAMPEAINAAQQQQLVAFVFGSETFGLSIQDITLCNRLITIHGNPNYFSLNLAQAVQVVGYELFSQLYQTLSFSSNRPQLASREAVIGLCQHWEQVMSDIGFFKQRSQTRLVRRMLRWLNKSQLEKEEIDILRGFLSTVEKKINH